MPIIPSDCHPLTLLPSTFVFMKYLHFQCGILPSSLTLFHEHICLFVHSTIWQIHRLSGKLTRVNKMCFPLHSTQHPRAKVVVKTGNTGGSDSKEHMQSGFSLAWYLTWVFLVYTVKSATSRVICPCDWLLFMTGVRGRVFGSKHRYWMYMTRLPTCPLEIWPCFISPPLSTQEYVTSYAYSTALFFLF